MWKQKVNAVMELHGWRRVNGTVASERTQTLTKEVVYAAIWLLHELGYKIQDPKNLGERHIEVLVKHWWYCQALLHKSGSASVERVALVA